jgi:PAS domain S-box-containing protein
LNLDAERRRRNLIRIAIAVAALSLVTICAQALYKPGPYILPLLAFPLSALGALWLGRSRLVDAGGLLLCLGPMPGVLAAVIERGQVGGILTIGPAGLILIAGLSLPLRHVLYVVAGAAVTVAASLVAVRSVPQTFSQTHALVVADALVVNTVVAFLALLSASSSAQALEESRRREERALEAERAARQAEHRYDLVTEHMSHLVTLLDEQGRHLYVSPTYTRLFGLQPSELLGQARMDFFHPDDQAGLRDLFYKARDNGAAGGMTLRASKGDGPWRWFEVRLNGFTSEGRKLVAMTTVDVTERKALEAQVQQSQKLEALGQLAGGVAHDFNNLLTVITGSLDLAREEIGGSSPATPDLDAAIDASRRATGLARQLLQFSRRNPEEKPVHIDVAEQLYQLEPLFRRLLGKNIALEVLCEPGCAVEIAPAEFEQLLLNLVVNARDAMPFGGALTVRATRRRSLAGHPLLSLEVQDTGTGMTEEVRARIFEPFFTTKAGGKGTGLGLATCAQIVRRLSGRIDVRSAPGQGATFTVLLPAPLSGRSPSSDPTLPAGAAAGTGGAA